MSKFNTFLVVIGMVLLALTTNAQLSFTFVPSNSSPGLGETITVDAVVNGFTDIASYQYSINWDNSAFSYQGLSNFNLTGLSAGSFGTTQSGNGILTTSWSDPFAGTQSLADGTVLFTLTLEVVAAGGVTTDVEFSSSPLGFEVIGDDGSGLTDITGSTTFNNATIEIAGGGAGGGGGGGGPTCSFSGFGVTVTSDSAATGDPVCLDVAVCNFTDIVSVQYTMQFDPNTVQFDEVNNFNLENLSAGNFGTNNAGNGFITMSWFDTLGAGVTIPDETVIYSVCFTAIGAGGEIDTLAINGALSPIEITDAGSGGSNIGLESTDGEITITGTSGSAVTFIASQEQGGVGDTVTVDVSVRNFDSIASFQGSMLWDPAIINFFDVQSAGTLPGTPNFNTSSTLTDAGKLTFSWDDPSATGVDLADDVIIYSIRYIVVGEVTDVSAVDITDDPLVIEVSQVNDGNLEVVPLAKIPGLVEVTGDGLLTLNINTVTGCTGDTVCIPITPQNFNGVVSMEYDVIWNSAELDYIRVENFGPNAMASSNFNEIGGNKLRLSWFEPLLDPQTLLDTDTVYSMCFEILAADGANIVVEFDQTGNIEITDGSNTIPYQINDGGVTVDCSSGAPMEVSDTTITNVLCNGDADGAIDVTVVNDVGTVTYTWSPNVGTTSNVTGLSAGNYTVTISDDNTTLIETYTVTEPAALAQTNTSENVSCNGADDGEATITPTGGTEPYSYTWSPNVGTTATVTGLSADTYDITVTDDNGTTTTTSVTIAEPPVLTANVTDTNVSCNGADDGTATVTPGGGNGGYSFEWSPGGATTAMITGLAPGQYTVTVTDAEGCTEEGTTFVSEPDVLSASGNVTHESSPGGNDGAIDVTPVGGTSGFTYAWDPNVGTTASISSLVPGDYTVTITDANNCTAIETFTVNLFDAPQITVVDVVHVACNGDNTGSIDISVSGGVMPYDYDWGGGIVSQDRSNLTAGNYTVTVTDALGTTAVETITINQASPVVIVVDGQNNVACNGDNTGSISISVSGGTPGYLYDWGGGETNEDPSGLAAGTYIPTIIDANGCTEIGPSVTITEPDPINISVVSSSNVNCNSEATGMIDISVTGGTLPYGYNWGAGGTNEDPSNLPAGTYTPTITDANGCIQIGPSVTISEPPALTANATATSVSCNGAADGTITLNVSGGVPNYTYNWDPFLPNQPNHTGVAAGTYNVTITDAVGCEIIEGPIAITQPIVLTVSHTVTNASAANDDGAIDLTVGGGTPNYSFTWDNGETTEDLSGLPSGCYAVTIDDANGCTVVDSIKVGGIIVVTDVTTDVSCAGSCDGSIDITVVGGIAPYTYSWVGVGTVPGSEDQTGLCAGNYAVTVSDSNGSLTSGTFTVGTPTALTISNTSIQDETGNGCNGSINITITGGTLPYTYQWSNGANNEDPVDLCKGDYNVTIVDANGCVLISPTLTVLPPPLVVSMDNTTMATCNGFADGEACVSILGGCGPYTLTLDGDQQTSVSGENVCYSELAAGSYSIVIQDSGTPQMVLVYPFTITEPDPVLITINNIIDNTDPTGTNCNGAVNIDVAGGSGNYVGYQWSNGDTSEDISGLCEDLSPYSVTVTDNNGCTGTLSGVEIDLGLSVQVNASEDVSCLGACDGSVDIEVFGGIQPYVYIWGPTGQTTQDVNSLCAGTYTVTVTDDNGNGSSVTTSVTINEPSSPLLVELGMVSNPTADAANGIIELNISGGWGGYEVSWSNGASGSQIGGLEEGFYTATVIDANGCAEILVVDLKADRLVLDFEIMQPNCNGLSDGQIEVIVSGGSEDYTITWSNGQAGDLAFSLPAGEYTVTVSDNNIAGLTAEETVDLGEPDALQVDVIITNATGPADGTLEAVVSGGTPNYTYLWNTPNADITPIVTRLPPAVYGLIVTDANGCDTIIQSIEVAIEGECLEARKVISPNNDGKNDELIISCVEGLDNNLKIFNRWGQMVYEADNYDNSWMGTDFDNQLLPESGYFWVLEYQEGGQTIQLKGAFTLLRGEN